MNVAKKLRHRPGQADQIITAIPGWAKYNGPPGKIVERGNQQVRRQIRTIAADDGGGARAFPETVFKCPRQSPAKVAIALRAANRLIAEPVMHRVLIAAGEANFEIRLRRATASEGGTERAQDEPAMQRRRAFRAQRRNEPRLYASRFGKTREQNQSAPAAHVFW